MSGICGIVFDNQDRILREADVLPMIQALSTSAQDRDLKAAFDIACLGADRFPGRVTGLARSNLHGQSSGMVFHGTIYNMPEISKIRVQKDSDFVLELLKAYFDEGVEFVKRLRGEFALAIWDGGTETLHVITDRFRVHPIVYYRDERKLVFASRLKALLACPFRLKLSINPEAVVNVVGSSFIPTPQTIYREVYKLSPGHCLSFSQRGVNVVPYWEINFNEADNRHEGALGREMRSLFSESVSVRFQQDEDLTRVGTFLSGGVDSTAVTGVLTRLRQPGIKCFSIGFEEPQFNEIQYARIAAKAFSADHYEYFVTPENVFDAIPLLLNSFDEPYANASAIPTYFCAKLARDHGVDVLYAGDGGDELFAGNERYASQRIFDYYHSIPKSLRQCFVEPLVFSLAQTVKLPLFLNGQKYIRRANLGYPERLFSYGFFNTISLSECLNDRFLDMLGDGYDPYKVIRSTYFKAPAQTELDRQLYIDLKLAISDNDLVKVTGMTEAAGVTVRYPFLDHHLAEFAARVPARLKMRRRELRTFFKKAYADLLPYEVRSKTKHGFGLPIPVWLRTDTRLNGMMLDLVLSQAAVERGYFRRKAIEDLVERHQTDATSYYGTILWNLMMLELWHRKWSDDFLVFRTWSD